MQTHTISYKKIYKFMPCDHNHYTINMTREWVFVPCCLVLPSTLGSSELVDTSCSFVDDFGLFYISNIITWVLLVFKSINMITKINLLSWSLSILKKYPSMFANTISYLDSSSTMEIFPFLYPNPVEYLEWFYLFNISIIFLVVLSSSFLFFFNWTLALSRYFLRENISPSII